MLPWRRVSDRARENWAGLSASRRILVCGLALITLQLSLRAWALSGSWFYFDDLAFMSRAMNEPMDAAYLFESYGGHLMPGGFAVIWLLTGWAAYSWWVWAAVLLAMQAVAGIGMLRLLRSMFGDTPVILVLLTGYLSLVFTLSAGIWFAAGINQLPLQIALVYGLHAHLQYLRTRRWQHLAVTLAWTGFGLLFYEKTLLLFGIYGLVALCWFSTGNTPARLKRLWQRYRWGVLVHTAVAVTYGLVYVKYGLNFSPSTAGTQPLTPVAWNLIGVAGSSGLIGGPLAWRPIDVGSFAEPSDLVQLASWLVIGTLVYYAILTRTISKRAWSLVGFTLACNVVLLGSARANIVGPDIALEYRYQTETAAMFLLSAGLAYLPLKGALVTNEIRAGVPRTYEKPPMILGVTAAIVIAAVISTVRYVDLWQSRNPTEAYYGRVVSSLDEAARKADGKPVPLVDGSIPQTMLWAYRYPENAFSHVFRNLDDKTTFPTTATDTLYVLDDKGRLAPAVVPTTRSMLPTPGCGYALEGDTTSIPLDGPVIGGGWWVRMSYYSPQGGQVHVTAGDEEHDLDLPAGLHNAFFTAAGDFSSITLSDYDDDMDLCVSDLALGPPQAAGKPS